MFTRSTLPSLAALVLLASGSVAGAEAYDAHAAPTGWMTRPSHSLSSSYALRSGIGRENIEPGLSSSSWLRAAVAAPWLDPSANGLRPASRLSFERVGDDVRAGSSASITLGRLNLNESRGPSLGGATQAELDRELAQLRESISRVRQAPQVSLGMHVKF